MGTRNFSADERFTEAERTSIGLIFERLLSRGVTPMMLYCLDSDGLPLVVFNRTFSDMQAELVGVITTEAMEYAEVLQH